MTLAETISDILKQQDTIQRDMGMEGSTTFYFNAFQDSFKVTSPYVITSTKTLGSSFVLGHPNTGRCWLGASVAGSIAVGSQPYLGDSRTSWAIRNISSPNNTFVETFDGSRFIKQSTGGVYTENTDQSDLIADNYTFNSTGINFYDYVDFMKFDISAFSGKTVSACSLFMKVAEYSSSDPLMNIWYLQTQSYAESDTGSKMISYPATSMITVNTPWTGIGQNAGVDTFSVFNLSHNVGSVYLCIRFQGSGIGYSINTSSAVGTTPYIRYGSTWNNRLGFYDRTSSLNYPYLKIQYTVASSGTTASWGSGSLYLVNGSTFETPSIYTGSNSISNIKLNLIGSTYNNLELMTSPNGVNWETCNSASVANYNFANTGSDLRLKFTASGGNAILTKYECVYGLN